MKAKRVSQAFCLLFLISLVKIFGMETMIPTPIKFQKQTPPPEPMQDIDDGFLVTANSVCPEVKVDEVETDGDGDVIMGEVKSALPNNVNVQNQKPNQQKLTMFSTQDGLFKCIQLLTSANVSEENKKTLRNALFENLWQIRENKLSAWFLLQLQQHGLENIWREVLKKLMELKI